MDQLFRQRKQQLLGFKKQKQKTIQLSPKKIPDDLYCKCSICECLLLVEVLEKSNGVCPKCEGLQTMSASSRISMICDKDSFKVLFSTTKKLNPLAFPQYEEKIRMNRNKTKLDEAIVCGLGYINKKKVAIAIMDSSFLMGSMGITVGEKLTRLIEYATIKKYPLVIFTASGGARMQEGIYSLMQMAKTSAAIKKHDEAGLLYISVITNPTYGGVSASFAMLGDIVIAEPGANLGFAGKRVIEETIREQLPEGFQSAEYVMNTGFVDCIVKREELRTELSKILTLH